MLREWLDVIVGDLAAGIAIGAGAGFGFAGMAAVGSSSVGGFGFDGWGGRERSPSLADSNPSALTTLSLPDDIGRLLLLETSGGGVGS